MATRVCVTPVAPTPNSTLFQQSEYVRARGGFLEHVLIVLFILLYSPDVRVSTIKSGRIVTSRNLWCSRPSKDRTNKSRGGELPCPRRPIRMFLRPLLKELSKTGMRSEASQIDMHLLPALFSTILTQYKEKNSLVAYTGRMGSASAFRPPLQLPPPRLPGPCP